MALKRIQHSIEHAAVRGSLALAGSVSHAAALRVGGALGGIAFDGARVRRDVSVDNITRALGVPVREATSIARRAYHNMGRSFLEFAAFARLQRSEVIDLVDLEGMEHVSGAIARGRGIVFVTGHFGNWELLGARLCAAGVAVDFLVGEQTNPRVDDVMNELRRRQGIGIIKRGMALRSVMKALSRNRMVCMLADQDARRNGIMVDFLGRPASTARGPAMFSIRSGAPIVTGFIHREGGRHRGVINPPIEPRARADEEEAVRVLTQAHADALARAIRERPDEYFWPHRRWKTRDL